MPNKLLNTAEARKYISFLVRKNNSHWVTETAIQEMLSAGNTQKQIREKFKVLADSDRHSFHSTTATKFKDLQQAKAERSLQPADDKIWQLFKSNPTAFVKE